MNDVRLVAKYLSSFERDVKRLNRKHVDLTPLYEVVEPVQRNDVQSVELLRTRHSMHDLSGNWAGTRNAMLRMPATGCLSGQPTKRLPTSSARALMTSYSSSPICVTTMAPTMVSTGFPLRYVTRVKTMPLARWRKYRVLKLPTGSKA